MIFSSDSEVDKNLYYYIFKINAAALHLYQNYSDSKVDDMVIFINNQGQQHAWTLNTIEEDPAYEQ